MPTNSVSLGLANFAFVKPKEKASTTGATKNIVMSATAGNTNKRPARADLAFRLLLNSRFRALVRVVIHFPFGKPVVAVATATTGH